jgi:hypothetical protein
MDTSPMRRQRRSRTKIPDKAPVPRRNRRRRLLLGTCGAFLLVLVGAWGYLLLRSGSPISQAGCDRINQGMTLAEVEVILGGPAGDYHASDRPVVVSLLPAPPPGLVNKAWIGNDGAVVVHLDQNDRVRYVHFAPKMNRNERFLEQLRPWLRL